MQEIKQRRITIGSFDLIKGFAMFITVFGHGLSMYPGHSFWIDLSLKTVSDGLMPLFFILSGFYCKKMSASKNFKKKAKELLIPYMWVAIVVIILRQIRGMIETGSFEISSMAVESALVYLLGIPKWGQTILGLKLRTSCTAIWFLLALFWCEIIVNAILHLQHEWMQYVVVICCAFLGIAGIRNDLYYFCFSQGLLAVGYMYLGYKLKQGKWFRRKIPITVKVGIVILCVSLIFWGRVDFAEGYIKNGVWDVLGAAALAVVLLYASLLANKFEGPVFEAIRGVGRYSYWIICIHTVEWKVIPWQAITKALIQNANVELIIVFILRSIVIALGCMLLKWISVFGRGNIKVK